MKARSCSVKVTMKSTDVSRLAKVALVACAGAFALLAGYGNVADFKGNAPFVAHVLMMDTTFQNPDIMGRAIMSPTIHLVAYIAIILTELGIGVLALFAAARMFAARRDVRRFNAAKAFAVIAVTVGVLLWYLGFLVIAGEWFAMWQSRDYNAQDAAFRIVVVMLIILSILLPQEHDAID
jgi:predicted small integral membrane protein